MIKDWYEKSIKALQLNGKGERAQEAYTRSVHMLVDFYHKTPDRGYIDWSTLRRWRK